MKKIALIMMLAILAAMLMSSIGKTPENLTGAGAAPLGARVKDAVPSPSQSPRKASLPAKRTNPRDGAEMVLVPAGEFLMGSTEREGGYDEHPQHRVHLDAYYIYRYEVTNGQFAKFVKETGYVAQGKWGNYCRPGMDRHPVVFVTWNDASAYCGWANVRLPTEAEWEKAARGADGRKYPWGSSWSDNRCNWFKGPKLPGMADIGQGRGHLPVGSFPLGASPFGALDMAGNVWEWCNDWYGATSYESSSPKNPRGPSMGKTHVVRGGSFNNDIPVCFRCADRYMMYPHNLGCTVGFRCASGPGFSAHPAQF